MDSDIEYRDYVRSDRAAVIELLSESRTARYRDVKSAIFDWQYSANPHSVGEPPFLVGVLGGKIVAVTGRMPVRIRYKGAMRRAIWNTDLYVATACRGRGFGRELERRVAATDELCLGYGISDMSDPILALHGWELSSEGSLFFFHSGEPRVKGLLKCAATSLRRWAGRKVVQSAPLRVVAIPALGEGSLAQEVDQLWQRCSGSYESAVERGVDYLAWKYCRHPRLMYEAYAARMQDRLEGVLIARWDPVESVIADYSGPRFGRILKTALVHSAVLDIVARGTVRIRCESTDHEFAYALRKCGFFVYPGGRGRFRASSRVPGDTTPTRDFFLMTGDSDNDCLTGT